MREIVRKHPRFFLAAAFAAIALRLLFVFRFPAITSDSFVYGDIAKNWLRHGNYGLGGGTEITPTCIRLPGYPAFLAAVFAVFGVEHYRAALLLQVFVDLGTCVLIADLARRLVSDRAAEAAFLLAALCPFLANYAAAALTETWEIFFTVLALDLAVVGVTSAKAWSVRPWLGCGLAIGTATLLRPDGGLLLIAVEIYLFALIARPTADERPQTAQLIKMASIVAVTFVACLVPWTLRNVRSLHQFQPLAPRYANDGNGFVPMGFIRWVKTWIADYASVEEVYWSVPSGPIDANLLPARAFDSPKQHEETARLIDGYNQSRQVTPDLDAGFAALAEERVHQAPLRYYISLPLLRIADMWLRPRTELLPCNTRWWEFDEDPQWLVLSVAIGIINLLYVGAALLGLVRRRLSFGFGMLLIFLFLRSMFLGTLENPEPRYTMECFPILILLAATLWQPRGNFIADGRSEIA